MKFALASLVRCSDHICIQTVVRGTRLQCVKAMMKLIVGISLVLATITVIGFDLIFALWWLLFPFVEAPVKSGLSAC